MRLGCCGMGRWAVGVFWAWDVVGSRKWRGRNGWSAWRNGTREWEWKCGSENVAMCSLMVGE